MDEEMVMPPELDMTKNKNSFPPQILALFVPSEAIPFVRPQKKEEPVAPEGVTSLLSFFNKPKKDKITVKKEEEEEGGGGEEEEEEEEEDINQKVRPPPPIILPPWKEDEIKKKKRDEEHQKKLAEDTQDWEKLKDDDPKKITDPYNTLFVCRLSKLTTEQTLRESFDEFGPIKYTRVVRDHNGESRGYAFVEFERSSDMKRAWKYSERKRINGRLVLVDVERARIVKGFRPRRLGGGLGETRKSQVSKKEREKKEREERRKKGQRIFGGRMRGGRRGGFGGGFRGGFRGGGRGRGGGGGYRGRGGGGYRGGGRGGGYGRKRDRSPFSSDFSDRGRKRRRF